MKRRYSTKVLFQHRIVINGDSGKRRLTEERIVLIYARTADSAYKQAISYCQDAEFRSTNEDGNPWYFEFVGILDLLELGAESDENEVWYDVRERILPMERKSVLIPNKKDLNAFSSK